MVEEIKDEEVLIALIIRDGHEAVGTEFYTEAHQPFQIGGLGRKKGDKISSHFHVPIKREINITQEVLFIKKGKLKVNFYREDKTFFDSRVLLPQDAVVLMRGGHGFEVLEDLQMIEVKQGPHAQGKDKICFTSEHEKEV